MDILGGKGICLGPSNFMGRAYQQLPIAITVEGANILTRSLIIFGQGAIRAHPHVLAEMRATREEDRHKASTTFDAALWAHVRFALANKVRAFVHGITASVLASTPDCAAETRRYYQHLARFSAAFAFLADVSMLVLGGSLKRREKLSARLGDILSLMYLASCTLKRYESDGRPQADLPLLRWAMQDTFARIQAAFEGVLSNYPNWVIGAALRFVIFPLGQWFEPPSDELGHRVARLLIAPSDTRDRLTAGMHLPKDEAEIIGALEAGLIAAVDAEAVEAKIRAAQKTGGLSVPENTDPASAALAANVISATEEACLARFRALRERVIAVDHFPRDFGREEAVAAPDHRAAA
jgi:acyl-CoA dehydrogenase